MKPPSLKFGVLLARQYVFGLPEMVCVLALKWTTPCVRVHGIRIIDPTPHPHCGFVQIAAESLNLISDSDPVRFKRLCRELRIVMHTPSSLAIGRYFRPLKLCDVDLRFFPEDQRELAKAFFASALIYGTTRGHLLSSGIIANDRKTYARIERLCCKEAQNFLRKIGIIQSPWDISTEADVKPVPMRERLRLIGEDIYRIFRLG